MQATTAKQVHELFVERFNARDVDGIMELYEPNAVILPPGAPEVVFGHVAIREVLDGFLALDGKMENTVVRVIEQQDIAILYSRWTVCGTGPAVQSNSARQTSNYQRNKRPLRKI